MFPLKFDDIPLRFPFVTMLLIAGCTGIFFWPPPLPAFSQGLVPVNLMYALLHPQHDAAIAATETIAAAFFMHAGIVHLISNMWYLWVFGAALEYTMGPLLFAGLYLVAGILSVLIQAMSSPLSTIPIIGASGAIAGVMGAFLVLLPLSRIVLYVPPIFLPRVPAFLFLILWFVIQYFNMRAAGPGAAGVAWWAHIGGFIVGLAFALECRRRGWIGKNAGRHKKPARQKQQVPGRNLR
jgi:membrane associated rhomboid family serine protease